MHTHTDKPPSAFGRGCFSDVTKLCRHCQPWWRGTASHFHCLGIIHAILFCRGDHTYHFSAISSNNIGGAFLLSSIWLHTLPLCKSPYSEPPINQTCYSCLLLRSAYLVLWVVSDLLLISVFRNILYMDCALDSIQAHASFLGISGLLWWAWRVYAQWL